MFEVQDVSIGLDGIGGNIVYLIVEYCHLSEL